MFKLIGVWCPSLGGLAHAAESRTKRVMFVLFVRFCFLDC
jgi:hypothetical protein